MILSTNIYWKNGQNKRVIKADKNQTICSTNFEGRTVESQLALPSSLD